MADVLSDVSPASMVHAVEANLFSFFPLLDAWPRAESHDDPRMLWTLSDAPFPLFNSVLRARIDAQEVDDVIAGAVERCRDRRVPMLWWTGPATKPPDLEARLSAWGFFADHATGMAIDLATSTAGGRAVTGGGRRLQPPPVGLAIAPVVEPAALATWCDVLCESFGATPAFGAAFADFAATVGLGPRSPLRHYLATIDGLPVATCSVFFAAGVAGIYDVATRPRWRRRGVGAAMTRAALGEARSRGYRMAILHSSPLGRGVYRSLGFQECCRIGQYVWVP